jgi:hypothetical protein
MKPTLLAIIIATTIVSCMRFNYYTINGENMAKTDGYLLVSENDTLKVEYEFNVHNENLTLRIFNKTDEVVEIDWKKAALIANDRAISYYSPDVLLAGKIEKDTSNAARYLAYVANVNATMTIDQAAQFIFPKSYLAKVSSSLSQIAHSGKLDSLKRAEGKKVTLFPGKYYSVSYERFQFSAGKSPLVFRSYLTFKMGKGTSQHEFSKEHVFYTSEVWQSSTSPGNFPEGLLNRPDKLLLHL